MNFIKWGDIDLKGKVSGQLKVTCPACIDRRSDKKDKSLSVHIDKGVGKCWYCEGVTIRDFEEKETKKFQLPPQEWRNYTNLSDKAVQYFKSRGISQSTLISCGITEEVFYQPKQQKEVNNIVFNYFEGDVLVNKKYRSANKDFTQSKGTKSIFYGINDIINSEEVYIVEGEIDKLSLYEIGIKNCISVPNGANDNDDVWKHCEKYLVNAKKFYIATDSDEKGDKVAEKIAQRLGRWRCERITFKNKDANGDLQVSRILLEESLSTPRKYPVSGTHTVSDLMGGIFDLYDKGIPDTIKGGDRWMAGLKKAFTTMLGHLVTVTGIPSHGKSSFTDWLVMNLIADNDMKSSWFSPEHSPMALHQSNFIKRFWGKPFFENTDGVERVTKKEIEIYRDWANEKIYLTQPEKGENPTWSYLFDKFKEQMYSYGINIFVIDAFNKVLFDERGGDKKSQIDEVLTRLTSFCQINNVVIFLVAHPTKMRKKDDGSYEVPTLYDVSGSADFRNQTHDGFTIYREFSNSGGNQIDRTIFHCLKQKFDFQGEIGAQVEFRYHKPSGRYYQSNHDYDSRPLVLQEKKNVFAHSSFESFENQSQFPPTEPEPF